MVPSNRVVNRIRFVALAAGTIAIGLAVYLRGGVLGATTRDVLGDALWAAMIFWLVGAVAPRAPVLRRGATSFGICVAVELGQLIRAPWLVAIRDTTLGHLMLGSGFDPRDLLAYAGGVSAAFLAERIVMTR